MELGARYNRFEDNVFSGNGSCGLQTDDPGTGYNEIVHNYFGVNASGTGTLPNWTTVQTSLTYRYSRIAAA